MNQDPNNFPGTPGQPFNKSREDVVALLVSLGAPNIVVAHINKRSDAAFKPEDAARINLYAKLLTLQKAVEDVNEAYRLALPNHPEPPKFTAKQNVTNDSLPVVLGRIEYSLSDQHDNDVNAYRDRI